MKKILLLLFILTSFLYAQKKTVTVSIAPQKYILDKIAKNKIRVKTLFKDSNFKVKFKQMTYRDLAESDIYMIMNLGIEKEFLSLVKTYNSSIEIFDMTKDIFKMNQNPYVWMDPLNVREMAKTVYYKLSDLDPKNLEFYKENYIKFAQEVDDLYVKMKLNFTKVSFSVYTFDSFWDYYLKRFDFRNYKVEKKVLSADKISQFIRSSKRREVEVLLIDKKTPTEIAKSIATNSTSKIIESDIYQYSFLGDMFILSNQIVEK